MAGREQALKRGVLHQAIGLVVALALLVLDHAALVVEPLLVERAEQVAHAVALHVQRLLQGRGRHGLEEVGAVEPGGAVPAGGAHVAQRLHQAAGQVFGRIEQADMFEQVGEARASFLFVLGADVVPGRDCNHWRLAVGVHDHAQAVVQGESLEGNVHAARQFGGRDGTGSLGGRRGRREGEANGDEKCGAVHQAVSRWMWLNVISTDWQRTVNAAISAV